MRFQATSPETMASQPRGKFAAARAFYLTLLVISIFAVWRVAVPGTPPGKAAGEVQLQKRDRLVPGQLSLTRSDVEVGPGRGYTVYY